MLNEFFEDNLGVTVTEVNIFQWSDAHSWLIKGVFMRDNIIKSIFSDVIVPKRPTDVYFRHSYLVEWHTFPLLICRLGLF